MDYVTVKIISLSLRELKQNRIKTLLFTWLICFVLDKLKLYCACRACTRQVINFSYLLSI